MGGYMSVTERLKEEGRQEGLQEGRYQVILKMLQEKTDISFIAKVTGLSEEEIKNLMKNQQSE